eukprot:1442560-Pyramimonas_sp.AAC.1
MRGSAIGCSNSRPRPCIFGGIPQARPKETRVGEELRKSSQQTSTRNVMQPSSPNDHARRRWRARTPNVHRHAHS